MLTPKPLILLKLSLEPHVYAISSNEIKKKMQIYTLVGTFMSGENSSQHTSDVDLQWPRAKVLNFETIKMLMMGSATVLGTV